MNLISLIFFLFVAQNVFGSPQAVPPSNDQQIAEVESSGWSSWSDWSTCSRSCGGGIEVQSRRCLHFQGCRGNSVRYNVCNMPPCPPGTPDFRYLQCAEYNTVHYNGELHEWEPAEEEEGYSCALVCRAKGMNGPPVALNARVIDGTRCGNDSQGMCVHGQCQTIGCDLSLASGKKKDSCGVCGGDGSSCRKKRLTKWVKRGLGPCSTTCGGGYRATKVFCEETETNQELDDEACSHSVKPFQEVSTCAEQACPASWSVGQWEDCSTTCGTGYQLREVSCVERRNETEIRVADHDCLAPRPPHRKSCGGSECPRWYGGIWSQCSVSCGEGIQRRAVQCRESSGRSSDTCSLAFRPESTRPCQTGVQCPVGILAHPRHLPFSAWSEESDENAPFLPSMEPLNKGEMVPAEPTFIAGSWSSCSTSCGEGIRTRNVTCKIFLEFSRTVAVLPDSQCPGTRPVEAKRCHLMPCTSLMLRESSKDQMEDISRRYTSLESLEPSALLPPKDKEPPIQHHAGVAFKLQSMEEQTPNDLGGFRFPSPNSEEEIPPRIVSLDSWKKEDSKAKEDGEYEILQPITYKYVWKQAGYTSCTASCLGGVQESISHCVREEDQKRVFVHLCDLKVRPDTITKTCNDHPCPPYWEKSDFQPCSKTCGGGITRRKVQCVHQVTAFTTRKLMLPDSLCPQPPPYAQKFCNMMPCPPVWIKGKWSECSVTCGKGIKTRTVDCVTVSSFEKQTKELPHKCPKERPASFRKCRAYSCGRRGERRRDTERQGPVIKAQTLQNYKQKKFMKTVILKVGGKASVFHGSNVKIKCPVRRFDRRNITWWKEGQQLGVHGNKFKRIRITKKGILKINRIQYTDADVYVCKAADQQANLTLRVQPLPASFASTEDGSFSPATRQGLKFDPKTDRNNVYGNGQIQLNTISSGSKFSDPPSFTKAGFQLEENHKLESDGDYFKRDNSSDPYKPSSLSIHTMEENSLEQRPTQPRTTVYGHLRHHGVPAGHTLPTKGITLLSTKVAQSKREWLSTLKESLPLKQESSQPAEEGDEKASIDEEPVYGTLLNSTENSSRLSSEEKMYFGTMLHSLKSSRLNAHNSTPSLEDSSTLLKSQLRDHKERSTEEIINEVKEDSLSALLAEDEPLFSHFTSGVPKFLGKGNQESLEFEWKVTNWTECSQTCSYSGSSRGYQVRSTQCRVRVNNNSQNVDGALCEDAGLSAPPTIQQCGFDECPQWKAYGWSDCANSRCFTLHHAYQKRDVACVLYNGTEVSSSQCDAVTKPRHKRECYNRECVGVWRTGDWSKCTAPCNGQGYRTRLLQCVWNGTKKSAGNACREQPRPEVVKWCDGEPCLEEDEDETVVESQCKDLSRYCKIVQRINMCRIQHYRRKCCRSCH